MESHLPRIQTLPHFKSRPGLSAQEITAVVQAWQNGALSRDSMMENRSTAQRGGGSLPRTG